MPASGLVQSTGDYSMVAIRHRHCVDLWAVAPPPAADANGDANSAGPPGKSPKLGPNRPAEGDDEDEEEEGSEGGDDRCALSLRIETKGSEPEHVHCFAMCPRGRALACSSAAGTRVWAIARSTARGGRAAVTKLDLPASVARSFSHAMAFSADGRRVAAYCVDAGSGGRGAPAGGTLVLLSLLDGPDADADADAGHGKGKGSARKRPRHASSSSAGRYAGFGPPGRR